VAKFFQQIYKKCLTKQLRCATIVVQTTREVKTMTNAQKLKALAENRKLIEIYANLKELQAQANDENIKIVIALLDKATDLLSEV
jgi:hypothetical protein